MVGLVCRDYSSADYTLQLYPSYFTSICDTVSILSQICAIKESNIIKGGYLDQIN